MAVEVTSSRNERLIIGGIVASAVVVLLAIAFSLWTSRSHDLDEGRSRVNHFSAMMAEHTARSFDSVDVLLRDIALDLGSSARDWRSWEGSRGWDYLLRREIRQLPQLRFLAMVDESGNQRFVSGIYPAPRISVRDRDYFTALANGAEKTGEGPLVGRNVNRYTYVLGRRVTDGEHFAGIVYASLEPVYFQEFCWLNRLGDSFETMLVNARNQIVASCRPADTSRQSPIIGHPADKALVAGRLAGKLPDRGNASIEGYLVSISPVPNYADLRVISLLPEEAVLHPWRGRLFEFAILATLVLAVLVFGGWLGRRKIRDLDRLTHDLAENRALLEQRVTEATRELAREKDAAELASSAKSRFLAAASHDLRQPLHALSLFAADLQRQVKGGQHADLPRLADQITNSAGLLGELLDSLLDISRLDMAGVKIHVQPFPIQSVFDRLASTFRRGAQNKQLRLRFRPTGWYAESDVALIERLLANLLSNAIRYTPNGGSILVAARRCQEGIRLEVRDSGIGIPPEHQASIFAEFYQVGNAAREQHKGLGLGLSIVDRLARALQCPVSLRSRPGEGTVFGVSLPGAAAPAAQEEPKKDELLVLFVGESADISTAHQLAANWGLNAYRLNRADALEDYLEGTTALVVTEAGLAAGILEKELLPDNGHLVVISEPHQDHPRGSHLLATPIRPAKLRALLEQLLKTLRG